MQREVAAFPFAVLRTKPKRARVHPARRQDRRGKLPRANCAPARVVGADAMNATLTTIEIAELGRTSALWTRPAAPVAVLVLAHGAGAGMAHPFLATFATELAAREIATLRFQFLYMERGSRRPPPPQNRAGTVCAPCRAGRAGL